MTTITAAARDELVALVVSMFNAAPGANNLSVLASMLGSGKTLMDVANFLVTRTEFATVYPATLTPDEFATRLAANMLGNEAGAAATNWAINWVKTQLAAGHSTAEVITTAVQAMRSTNNADFLNAKTMLANKVEVASYYSVTRQMSSTSLATLQSIIKDVTSDGLTVILHEAAMDNETILPEGQVYSLTAGIDSITATSGNDSINSDSPGYLSANDSIDGGAGIDVLNISDTTAINIPSSVIVKNVETANLVSLAGIAGDVSGWTGLTMLTTNGAAGSQNLVAAATTNVDAIDFNAANNDVSIAGGNNVSITATDITAGGIITAGIAGVAAKGAVTIAVTEAATATTGTADAINVTGGTVISITANLAGAVNNTITAGAVSVTGTADTTAVAVVNTPAAIASPTVAGVADNTVTITDADYLSTSHSGTLSIIAISGYSSATINDNALTQLGLTNGSGNITINNGGLITPVNLTLGLTVNGLTGGILADTNIYSTLNVTTTGNSSTLANIADAALTTLTITGDKNLTLISTAGMSVLKSVSVSGSAGLTADLSGRTFLTAVDTSATTGTSAITLGQTKVVFTGGAGVDNVTVGNGANIVTTGTGADAITINGAAANANAYTTITDPHAGMKLSFGQAMGTANFTAAKISLADTAGFQTYLDAAAAGDGSANSKVAWFQYSGNTYVVEDNTASPIYFSGFDTVVKLTGLVDLGTATFTAAVGASASLTLA